MRWRQACVCLVVLAVMAGTMTLAAEEEDNRSTPTLPVAGPASGVVEKRLAIARQYLLLAGIEAPPSLGAENVPALKEAFRRWIARAQPESAAVSTNVVPTASARVAITQAAGWIDSHSNAPLSLRGLRASHLLPGAGQRFMRSLGPKWEISDLPNTVVEDDMPSRNLEGVLWKVSFTFNPGDLLTNETDYSTAYSALSKYKADFKLDLKSADPYPHTIPEIEKFALTDFRGKIQRALALFSVSFGLAERPLSERDLSPGKQDKDEIVESLTIKFDPSRLYDVGTSRKLAYETLLNYAKTFEKGLLGVPIPRSCTDPQEVLNNARNCLAALSHTTNGWRTLATFLPTIEFKTVDEYDFIKAGGQFTERLFPDERLETWTITWDLKRAFGVASRRADALSVLQTMKQLAAPAPQITVPAQPAARIDEWFSFQLQIPPEVADGKWEFIDAGGQALSDSPVRGIELGKKSGLLSGYPMQAGTFNFKVRVRDAFGREASSPVTLVVKGPDLHSRAHILILDYVEIMHMPERLADDSWFERFQERWRAVLSGVEADFLARQHTAVD